MKTTTQFSPRALSVIVLLMFLSALLNAQIKIKERVELTSKAAVSNTNTSTGDMPQTYSLNYPAQVDGPMIGFYASWLNTTISYGSTNCYTRPEYPVNHLFWTVTCNGVIVRCNDSPCPDDAQPGEYSGFGGTFGSFSPGQLSFGYAYTDDNISIQNNPIYFYIGWDATHSYGGYPDDCGGALGLYQICGLNEDGTWVYCQLPDYTVTLTRLTFCPPIEIFYNGVSSIMYMDAQEIKIGLQDACGKNTQGLGLTPVKYYVAITSGKEWGYLYNQATGQYGDSIVCTASDCDTSFIFMAMNQQPNEDQEVILSVWSDNTSFIPATGTIIVQSTKCMTLSLPKPQILPGESERISLMQNYWDGTLSPYSSYQTFSIKLNTDGKYYGTLHCVATGDTGVALIGLPEPFEFIAAGSIDVDSVVVEIEAVAQVMQSFPTSIGTVTKDTLRVSKPVMVKRTTNSSTIAALPSEVNKKNKEYLIERLQLQLDKKSTNKGDEKLKQKIANTIKDLKSQFVDETVKKSTQKLNSLKNITEVSLNTFGEAGCTGKASVTIKKKHLELRSTSGTVYYGDTVDVFIVPCNNSDSLFSQIGPDQDYTFSVALTGETSRYGKLLFNGQSVDSVESVPSVEGKGVGVKFAATGIEPDSTVDLTFHLKATYIGTEWSGSIKESSTSHTSNILSKSVQTEKSSVGIIQKKGQFGNPLLNNSGNNIITNKLIKQNSSLKIEGVTSYIVLQNSWAEEEVQPIIKLTARDIILKPLGDLDNKRADPTCKVPKGKEDTCDKIIDFSKVDTTRIYISVKKLNGEPVPNYPFTISAYIRAFSGGHDHDKNRPMGRFIYSDDTVSTFSDKTGNDGKANYKYLSSGFGGFDSLFVKGKTEKDTSTRIIQLKMNDFVELTTGEHYFLTGAYTNGKDGVTSQHRKNHFGTSNFVSKLKIIADTIFQKLDFKIQFNDMSLIYGGPFDCDTLRYWNTPHRTHRNGISVDVGKILKNGTNTKSLSENQLKKCIRYTGLKEGTDFKVGKEPTHWHLTIY